MDFWTQSSGAGAKADARHLMTHVAPGHATLAWTEWAVPGAGRNTSRSVADPLAGLGQPSIPGAAWNCSCAGASAQCCIQPAKSWGCAPDQIIKWWQQHGCKLVDGRPCKQKTCKETCWDPPATAVTNFTATQELSLGRVNSTVGTRSVASNLSNHPLACMVAGG